MSRTVRTKLPTIPRVNPDVEVIQKDQEAKACMKAYADLKRRTRPHSLNVGDHALVKKDIKTRQALVSGLSRKQSKMLKGSMITAKRATDQKLVTRNNSFFEKLPNPLEEVIQGSSPVLRWIYKPRLILMDRKPLNTLKCQLLKRSLIRLPQVKSAQ